MPPTLRPLRGYEPSNTQARLTLADFVDAFEPLDRWSSLRPVNEPQVTVEPTQDNGPFQRMLTKILEVLDGRRQIGQLQSLLAGPVFEATLTRLRVTPPIGVRYQLQSVRSCRPSADAIELCGRVETSRVGVKDRRAQALVARLERHHGKWQCVFLRLL